MTYVRYVIYKKIRANERGFTVSTTLFETAGIPKPDEQGMQQVFYANRSVPIST